MHAVKKMLALHPRPLQNVFVNKGLIEEVTIGLIQVIITEDVS